MPLWLPIDRPTPDNELQLFLGQAWCELLHPQTPDSFRARVLDLSLSLDDIFHVADVAESDRRWAGYLPAMAQELGEHLSAEQRLIAIGSPTYLAIQAVIEDARHERVGRLKSKIQIAKGLYGPAEERLHVDLARLVIASPVPKEALLMRLATVASHISYRGLGEESLKLVAPDVLNIGKGELVDRIFSPLRSREKLFRCTLAISGNANALPYILKGTNFKRIKRRLLASEPSFTQWLERYDSCLFARVDINARSAYSAAEQAMQGLAEALNVHNLYVNRADSRVHSGVMVGEPSEEKYVQVAPSSHFGLLPRSRSLSLTIDRLKRVNVRMQGRLANALECHAIALAAQDPRTAIINLWTALEAIAGTSDNASIGSRVAGSISPIVSSRRIDKIITYFSLGIHEILVRQGKFVDNSILRRSSYTEICNDDVLEALSGQVNNSKIRYLLSLCEPTPLLRQRLYLAWKSFHDSRRVSFELMESRQRVEWQIYRIYRARNLLIHKGEHSHLIWRLLQNAQYYVSATVSRVLHDLSDQSSWGIDESLTYQAMHFNYVCDRLKEGKAVTHKDVLGTRSSDPNAEIWGTP